MENKRKVELLSGILSQTKEVSGASSFNEIFKKWHNTTKRTLIKIFGEDSKQVRRFNSFEFEYDPGMGIGGLDYTEYHRKTYQKGIQSTIALVNEYLEIIQDEIDETNMPQHTKTVSSNLTKVFISHSSEDKKIVQQLINILEATGLRSENIFCSSFPGYGVKLGEDFLLRIKSELNENVLVLFILSSNFYNSPVCLCEMGASWMKTNDHIPILIPPFTFKDVKGVIPLTHGFVINDELSINSLKERIEKKFGLSQVDQTVWLSKSRDIMKKVKRLI